MQVTIKVGDVLTAAADVLISTANPWLNLSGGVNGAIREAVGSDLQIELHEYLKQRGLSAVPAGTVVRSNAYSLPFRHILHAVAIDPFYDSSAKVVETAFGKALELALKLQSLTVSSPTLATGYGPISVAEFGTAIAPVLIRNNLAKMSLTLVVRQPDNARELYEALFGAGVPVNGVD